MNIFVADDEKLALDMLESAVKEVVPRASISRFQKPSELLREAEQTHCDIAFLDIQMPGMTGVELALKLKNINPKINIIFVTGYDEYAGNAMAMHASGYIKKPVTPESVAVEMDNLRHPVSEESGSMTRIRCFGNFDIFDKNGNPISFERAKSRELLAYLVYRKGATCTVKEIAGVLFEDASYDRKQQNYLQKIISSLIRTLKEYDLDEIVLRERNGVSIKAEAVNCDYYRFLKLDPKAVNAYHGEFMSQYSWAEFVVGYLDKVYYQGK